MDSDSIAASNVSVIIATHNRPTMLIRAVESVTQQISPPGEIVIINDGSDTSYKRSLEEIKRGLQPDIELIYERLSTSGGAAKARNIGVKESSGSIIMFLDDDDRWRPEKIANQIQIFQNNPGVGMVYSGRIVVNEKGEELYKITPQYQGDLYRTLLEKNVIGVTSSVAMRRSLFEQVGGFDPKMPARQDYDLWIRAAKHTQIGYDPSATVEWSTQIERGAQMSSRPDLYRDAVQRFFTKYAKELDQLPWYQRRRAYATQYSTLAEKYSHSKSSMKYRYAIRSLLYYPSASALVNLLPRSIDLKLRKLVR